MEKVSRCLETDQLDSSVLPALESFLGISLSFLKGEPAGLIGGRGHGCVTVLEPGAVGAGAAVATTVPVQHSNLLRPCSSL